MIHSFRPIPLMLSLALLPACGSSVSADPFANDTGKASFEPENSAAESNAQPANSDNPEATEAPQSSSTGSSEPSSQQSDRVDADAVESEPVDSAPIDSTLIADELVDETPPAVVQATVVCASYEDSFLPLVHDPVCSNCHSDGARLPVFEPFAEAGRRCQQIGREVATASMPPNGSLSGEQRALVAEWVGLGCPETADDAAALCDITNQASPQNPDTPPASDDDDDDDDD